MDGPTTPEIPTPGLKNAFAATYEVRKTEDIPLLQKAAEATGIKVNVIAREGQTYTTLPPVTEVNGQNLVGVSNEPEYHGTLGPGENYVMISGMVKLGSGLQEYWDAYKKLVAEQKATEVK